MFLAKQHPFIKSVYHSFSSNVVETLKYFWKLILTSQTSNWLKSTFDYSLQNLCLHLDLKLKPSKINNIYIMYIVCLFIAFLQSLCVQDATSWTLAFLRLKYLRADRRKNEIEQTSNQEMAVFNSLYGS